MAISEVMKEKVKRAFNAILTRSRFLPREAGTGTTADWQVRTAIASFTDPSIV